MTRHPAPLRPLRCTPAQTRKVSFTALLPRIVLQACASFVRMTTFGYRALRCDLCKGRPNDRQLLGLTRPAKPHGARRVGRSGRTRSMR